MASDKTHTLANYFILHAQVLTAAHPNVGAFSVSSKINTVNLLVNPFVFLYIYIVRYVYIYLCRNRVKRVCCVLSGVSYLLW